MSITDMLSKISSSRQTTSAAPASASQSISSIYGQQPASLDPQRVRELWIRYARSIGEQDTHLYSLMQQVPNVDGTTVVVSVNNKMQAEKMLDSSDLVNFLRNETGVSQLSLHVNVSEDEVVEGNAPRRAYTSKEKLDELVALNPVLDKLVKELSLDVDF